MSWWAKWVDETVWVSKNGYAIFSEAFKDEVFFNRGGFLGVEKVPGDAVEAIEKEFAKRRRPTPSILVEDGRRWDRMRAYLASKGYVVGDRMLVLESLPGGPGKPLSNSAVVDLVSPGSGEREGVREWTRVYLQAFYGNQRLSEKVNEVMRKVVRDKKAAVFLARVGQAPAGCGAMYRTVGGVAGAYCIGTAPAFRGRGVATAIVKSMREVAGREGRRLVLQTMDSDEVEGLYLKAGFTRAYAKSVFERRPGNGRTEKRMVPSGEVLGVRINRDTTAGTTRRFTEVFSGFEKVGSVRRLFGSRTEEVFSNLRVSLDSPRGYLRVDGETGNIMVNPDYLRTGEERHLYLDVIHELAHVKQFREGKELYDRRYSYFERPTEIEAYRVAVEEARKIGMDRDEIIEYLRVEWVTEEEFVRFVSTMRIE